MKIGRIRAETVAEFVAAMEQKRPRGRKDPRARLKGWTVQGALTPLSGIFKYAVRRGYVGFNPVQQLERDELPKKNEREKRIIGPGEIKALLAASPEQSWRLAAAANRYRPILFTAVYTGLRFGELLGLRWGDLDFTKGVLRVRRQVTQKGEAVDYTKTEAGRREVDLAPEVASALAKLWASSRYSDDDYVFASTTGTPLNYRNVERRGLDVAAATAGIRGEPKLRFHDLRHTYASMLIDGGATPEDVCAQMGHANPSITMRTYTHQFNARRARDRVLAAISPNVASLWQVEVGTNGNGIVEALDGNGLSEPNP
jgi:integrase